MRKKCFDEETFFQRYKKIRESEKNYNDLLEQPAMYDYLPDVSGKKILDIGCGFGKNCRDFIEQGAFHVLGIDCSKYMIDEARKESGHMNIEYLKLDAENLNEIRESFDLVYSSLVFHYIEDFEKLVKDIYNITKKDGILLFSQEHPIITASPELGWNYDKKGREISYSFTEYNIQGRRGSHWFIDDVVIYHRTMGTIVTTLATHGFHIEALYETAPKKFAVKQYPKLKKEFLKPNFLIVRARKM